MDTEYYSSSYMGPKADKLKSQKFSIPAFFLGPIYFAYRKMFMQGFLMLILLLVFPVIGSAVHIPFIGAFSLVMAIVQGFLFPKMYKNEASRRVTLILATNPNMPDESCRKAGGTSMGKALIMFLVEIIMVIILLVLILVVFAGSAIVKGGKEVVDTLSNGPETFTGLTVYDTSTNLDELVSYTVPDYFELVESDEDIPRNYEAYFDNEDNACLELSVSTININADVKDYAKSHQEYASSDDDTYSLTSKEYGDLSWEIVKGVSDLSSHAYAKVNDKVILVELKQGIFNNNEINFGNADKLFEQILGTFSTDTSKDSSKTKFVGLETVFLLDEEDDEEPEEDDDTNTVSTNTLVENTVSIDDNTNTVEENTNTTETPEVSNTDYQAVKDEILEKSPRLNVLDFININVPEGFTELTEGMYRYNLSDSRKATFEATVLRKYTNLESLLEAINGVGDKMSLGTMPTNDIDWNTQVCFDNNDQDLGIMYLWAEINDYVVQIKIDYGKAISDETEIANLNQAFVDFLNGVTKK